MIAFQFQGTSENLKIKIYVMFGYDMIHIAEHVHVQMQHLEIYESS